MFWTQRLPAPGSIWTARMDGTHPVQVLSGLDSPGGIVVDVGSSKVIWADDTSHRIMSSDFRGNNLKTVIQASDGAGTFGIALHKDRIYYGEFWTKSLQSGNKLGREMRNMYSGRHKIRHLTMVNVNFPDGRQNHCEGKSCSNICGLTSNSSRCVA